MSPDNHIKSTSNISCIVILENEIQVGAFQKHTCIFYNLFSLWTDFQDKLISALPFDSATHQPFVLPLTHLLK